MEQYKHLLLCYCFKQYFQENFRELSPSNLPEQLTFLMGFLLILAALSYFGLAFMSHQSCAGTMGRRLLPPDLGSGCASAA